MTKKDFNSSLSKIEKKIASGKARKSAKFQKSLEDQKAKTRERLFDDDSSVQAAIANGWF